RLIMVRHGETIWNREKRVQGFSDVDLSEEGLIQTEKLAIALREKRIEAICTSPLRRAFHTARTIGKFHHLPLMIEPQLKELIQGDLEGKTYLELRDDYGSLLAQWLENPASFIMPNGESLAQLQERAWPVIERLIRADKDTLVVSHSFTIMVLLCRIRGLDLSRVREVQVGLASRTEVEINNGRWEVEIFNDTSHLQCE
ncbi:MAG: histidine phosphatase family protein, partial [Smithellaceae bacterium]|nr:histidine phosphatase family protein [Smithellaceae bacterium]